MAYLAHEMAFPEARAVELPERSVITRGGWEASLRELEGWVGHQVGVLVRSMGDGQGREAWRDSLPLRRVVDPHRKEAFRLGQRNSEVLNNSLALGVLRGVVRVGEALPALLEVV